MTSRYTRRMNSRSVHRSEGRIRIRLSLAKTAWSTTLSRGTSALHEAGHLDQVGQTHVGDQVEIVGDDRDLAPGLEPDVSLGVDLGDLRVGRVVVADRGDVVRGAVRHRRPSPRVAASRPAPSGRGSRAGSPAGRRSGRRGRRWPPRRSSRAGIRRSSSVRDSRSPPSWGTSPSGLRRSRLVSAAIGLMRRPPASRERIAKSWSGR